jgi:feruloyl esterase
MGEVYQANDQKIGCDARREVLRGFSQYFTQWTSRGIYRTEGMPVTINSGVVNMMARWMFYAVALTIVSGGEASLRSQIVNSSSIECLVPKVQAKAPKGTTIIAASMVPEKDGLPEYCQIEGHVAVPGNEVNFRLGLPSKWNGKFFFSGVGGLGGTIGPLNAGLKRGYATASTDTGHKASDPSWGADRAKEIDYGYRGTHVTAIAAKKLTAGYFGKTPVQAYFEGCSNGGRQALMEAQRYPADFDGVIAGSPATGMPMQVRRALVYQHMLLSPENYLPIGKVELLARATLAECDSKDGLEDGLITDPRLCALNTERLQCAGDDAPDCLTKAQVSTVNKIYSPVRKPDGKLYAAGLPIGHESGSTGWGLWIVGLAAPTLQANGTLAFGSQTPAGYMVSEAYMRFLATENDDVSLNWKTLNFPQDLPRLALMSKILSPQDPDLRPYKKRGGKIIFYHGWADPGISAYGTLDYYETMRSILGGQREADAFSRLYLVPGMHHCGGGPGPNSFDMLTVLESWVEKGVAPSSVIASHSTGGKIDRTRPLCPHPLVAIYTGNGSIDDAANFRCEAFEELKQRVPVK